MSKWMSKLAKMEGASDKEYDRFLQENVIQTFSPSFNWIFGKGHGLPYGYTMVLYGEPKAGKSLITNTFVEALHAKDKEAIALKFDTEMRDDGKLEDCWNIDPERYQVFNVNEPELIFDRIKHDIQAMIQEGMPLKLIIIDSLKGIQGVKESNRESVTNHLMGDHAKTIGDGLKAILPILRRNKISLICTQHIRANLDAGQYGPKIKMGGAWAEKHFFEYYVEVKKNNSSEGKSTAAGDSFEADVKDFKGKNELHGRKLFVKMADNTKSVSGRTGQLTFTFEDGLTNIEEELFELSKNLNIVERPNNRTYIMGEKKFSSKLEFLNAIKNDPDIAKAILEALYSKDRV